MAPHDDSDWSDSDDEELSEMETSVLLGIPDGPIEKQEEADDAAVSRIGGYPVRNVVLYSIACTVNNNRHFFLAFVYDTFVKTSPHPSLFPQYNAVTHLFQHITLFFPVMLEDYDS